MKKLFAILLALSLFFALPALAELGSADVSFQGKSYHVTLDGMEIRNGRLRLVIGGMTESFGIVPTANGFELRYAATAVPYYGDKALYATDKDIAVGDKFTFSFNRDTLPDSIMLVPTEQEQEPILLWERKSSAADTAIPEKLVGQWRGTGRPKNGDSSIDLSVTINADGTGEYTFDQNGYHESWPFTITNDDSRFSVVIPATSQLGSVDGTWALEDDILKLDITSTFTGGGSYSYTAECKKAEAAETHTRAQPGERVRLDGMDVALDLRLFTATFDNWGLLSATTNRPFPANGAVYLLRFALADEEDAMTLGDIADKVAPALCLRAQSNGDLGKVFQTVTPDDEATRVFDILFYCKSRHELSDMELLSGGMLYPLGGLPRDGERLPLPTAEEKAVAKLNEMHRRAISENNGSIDEAICTSDVIVAVYTSSGENATPQVLTAHSEDEYAFPREYRAESYDTARWAAIIFPTRVQVGRYNGIAGGAANRTYTWLSLFDLETGRQYKEKVATEEPPRSITVKTINGIPVSSGASGKFRREDAINRLTQLVEAARKALTP